MSTGSTMLRRRARLRSEMPSVATTSTGARQVGDGGAVEEASVAEADIGQQVAVTGRLVGEHCVRCRRRPSVR